MAIPPFLEFAKMQTERAQQQDPMDAITGALEGIVKGKQEKEKAAAAKQYGEARLEEQQLKADKERQLIAKQKQDMEHARLLAPYQRNLVKAKVEKEKVPLEELASLNYHQKQARDAGDTETADLYKGMMHDYASMHYQQADVAKIMGLKDQRDKLRVEGDEEGADIFDKIIKEKITPPGKVLGEVAKLEAKNFSEYKKNAANDAKTAESANARIKNVLHHYDKTFGLFRGGSVAATTKLGAFFRKQAPAWSDHFYEMTKEIGRLQQEDLQKLKTGGRMTVAQQELVAASTLDPTLGKGGMQRMGYELMASNDQLKEKGKFIDEAEKRGINNPLVLNNAWNNYLEENPAYSVSKKDRGVINEDALSKKTWEKYIPGTQESYTDAEIDYAAKKRGITREEVIRKLKAAGKM